MPRRRSEAIPAIRESKPLIRTIRSYSTRSKANTALAARLFTNLQRHGFSEEFLSVFYYVATSLARFDGTSHILPLYLIAPQNGACGQYATKPVAGCSAHYGQQASYEPQHRSGAHKQSPTAAPQAAATGGRAAHAPAAAASPGAPPGASSGSPPSPAPLPNLPLPTPPPLPPKVLQALTSFLIK